MYHRGCFVWESKKLNLSGTGKLFPQTMENAHGQAQNDARALLALEGRSPFVVVADVGNVIEFYAEFTRSGATYTPALPERSRREPSSRRKPRSKKRVSEG